MCRHDPMRASYGRSIMVGMTASKKSQLDQPWPYGWLTTPLFWGVATLGAGGVLHAFEVQWWVVALGGGVLALLAPLVASGIDSPRLSCWFAALLSAAAGAWLTLTSATTPWVGQRVLELAFGVMVFGGWWRVVRHINTGRDHAAERAAADQAKAIAREDLPAILAHCGFKGMEGGPVTTFAAGTSQVLTLPSNGSVTFKRLHAATDQIMVAARAEYPIRFTPGKTAAQVIAVRMNRDVLAEQIPYPIERVPHSIHQPIPLGVREDGEEASIVFRELSGLFVGERGSGKSGLINAHLAYLTSCPDVVVWVIDGKGGRTARPWLPAVDWVATTQAEADVMLLAAKCAIGGRSTGDGEKIEPHPGMPAIVLIVEEASLITGAGNVGNHQRAALAKDVVVLGRSEAVDVIVVAQRGTVTMLGSGDMKSQLQYRVGLGISKLDDAQRVFDNSPAMAREMLTYADDDRYKGVFLAKAPGWRDILPIKGYWLEPRDIPGVATSNAQFKGHLDQGTIDAIETGLVEAGMPSYGARWDRWHGDTETVVSRPRVSTAEALGLPESPLVARLRETRDTETRDIPAGDTGTRPMSHAPETPPVDDLETLETLWAMSPAEGDTVPHQEAEQVVPPILLAVNAVFAGRGQMRLHTETILEHLSPKITSRRLGVLMAHCGVSRVPNAFEVDGTRARGYAAEDIARAIGAARDGRVVHRAAFDWPESAE